MSSKQYPPIKSWIIGITIAVILFIICDVFAAKYGDLISLEQRKVQAAYLLDYSLNNIKDEPGKVQVVAVGSSIVGNGVACASELDNKYSNVCLTKLYLNSNVDVLKIFDEIGAFDSLLVHPPDILLIQVDQLAYDFEKNILNDRFFRGAFFLYDLHALITKKSHKYKMPKYCGATNKSTLSDTTLYEYKKMHLASFDDRKYIHYKLEALSKKGVKIYLIHVPRPLVSESNLHQEIQDEKFNQLIEQYQKMTHSTYIEYPEKLNFKYFYDFGHLNNMGRKKYSDWLYSKIICSKK